jgi:enoyl-CoA hydratase/carnithine racemase
VAAIHGWALGAGCEMALFCDLRVASDNAQLGLPEVNLGYIPSAGGTQMLPRIVPRGLAMQMILTGEPLPASRALEIGLVHRVVPRQRLDGEACSLASVLASRPPEVLAALKRALNDGLALPLPLALQREAQIGVSLRVNG